MLPWTCIPSEESLNEKKGGGGGGGYREWTVSEQYSLQLEGKENKKKVRKIQY